ncbi:c-type cytochrome [Sphingomonas gei]|uniref:c-type cytochrome n=1 Tax=Sphingomonas gei TaxID=1395960 RepID=UPI001F0E4201|nr:c-type cytochrome [Sphingomonas gei]
MIRTQSCLATTMIGAATLLAVTAGPGAKGGVVAMATVQVAPPRPAFATCKACHSVTRGGTNGVGPNLFGIFGAPAAAKPGYAYSPAMKGSKIRWERAKLDAYLADPRAVVPGTRMTVPGIPDPAKRNEIIGFLEKLK